MADALEEDSPTHRPDRTEPPHTVAAAGAAGSRDDATGCRRDAYGPDEWYVGEDGCLTVPGADEDDGIAAVVYHPSLNVILVTTRSATVRVVDVTSGAVFHSSDLSGV